MEELERISLGWGCGPPAGGLQAFMDNHNVGSCRECGRVMGLIDILESWDLKWRSWKLGKRSVPRAGGDFVKYEVVV